MNKVLIIGVVVALVVGGFLLLSKPSDNTAVQASQNEQLSYETIMQAVTSGTAALYDVRTPEEYAEGYIADAVNFPLQTIESGQYPSDSKDTTIYIYCRSGNRSAVAKSLLEAQGFKNVVDLGGYPEVQAIGGTWIQ